MKVLLIISLFLLSACGTIVPKSIQQIPENNLQLRHTQLGDFQQFVGREVRWGGKIINVSKANGAALFEIKQRPLNAAGFPLQNISSQGTFFAQVGQSLDLKQYREGLLITFVGIITPEQYKAKENHHKMTPIITASELQLWPYYIKGDLAYSYTGAESKVSGYGIEGSGHYKIY